MPNIEIKNDGGICIATGSSRKSLIWKNQELTWSALLDRLSKTARTGETAAEYTKLSKDEQDRKKDVGGFVGGKLKGGRRKADMVLCRSILTLDADFATVGFWDTFTMLYDYAACIYSTHKHSPAKPRLRFLVPLTREVTAEEYGAISRRIAADLGIEQFDDTTYEPSRLMYWPSTSQDAEFVFKYQDGEWLDPDKVLGTYHDWHDVAEWPVSSRAAGVQKKQAEKQGNPLEKRGVIGAFCRTYTIQDAIDTFLHEIYTPCAVPGRYTYAGGSTYAGVIVYDDVFAYSHHATDPAGGKLCNAFDLVRLHLFGDRDEETAADTPVTKMPSYTAMLEFVQKDERTQELLIEEKQASIAADFGSAPTEYDNSWMKKLEKNSDDNILKTIENFYLIVKNDARLRDAICVNEFSRRLVLRKDVPWRKIKDSVNGEVWTDTDDSCLRNFVEQSYRVHNAQKLTDAFNRVSQENTFHPVREYLMGLVWDGVPRLDSLLINYLGAEDNPYTRMVTSKALIGAVARVMQPGCKFDEMLVLVGPQGIGKSTLFRLLGRGWYSDSLTSVSDGKNSYEQLQGVWIIEMGELNAMRKKEAEEVKNFLSKCEDIYRAAYGRHASVYPRQCIFVGTTNKANFLQDSTGDRRFWPVDVGTVEPKRSIWKELTEDEVGQIWAEAYVRYKQGEVWHLDRDETKRALEAQEAHKIDNPRVDMVRNYLEKLLPEDWYEQDISYRAAYFSEGFSQSKNGVLHRKAVCALEIWRECFGRYDSDCGKGAANEIHDIMLQIPGWEKRVSYKSFGPYGRQRNWHEWVGNATESQEGDDFC